MLNVILKGMVYPYKYTDVGKLPFAENSPAVLSSAEQVDYSAECTVARSSLTLGEVSGAGGVVLLRKFHVVWVLYNLFCHTFWIQVSLIALLSHGFIQTQQKQNKTHLNHLG